MSGPQSYQDVTSDALIKGLEHIGYRGQLLQRNYGFADWFAGQKERTLTAAAFGQTPVSYESACIAIAKRNGASGHALVNEFRAFGAPILLEVDHDEVREWAVSRTENQHTLIGQYPATAIDRAVVDRAQDWMPDTLMRAKNIGSYRWIEQLGLFAGLIPELENQIQNTLDPLLRDTLSRTREAFEESSDKPLDDRELFQMVFWTLTAKVFHDRRVRGFADLGPDPDQLLPAVAAHYNRKTPRLLNAQARRIAAHNVWRDLDFRNLSVEVLAHIWSRTLVDDTTRKRLGIHRTPRAIVRYIIERIPFSSIGDDKRIIFEPCSGSAAFLIGALNFLRPSLFFTSAEERHSYFVQRLAGIEYDSFGVEISALSLTLADFPNPNGWEIQQADAFIPGSMTKYLRQAGIVLCNPPFERLRARDRERYQATEARKPAELLHRVLADLHPSGVLGFVLPYTAVDGREYSSTRKLLAERFQSIELTVLPDKVFDESESEIALLIAKDPIPHATTRVSFRRVDKSMWQEFQREHSISSEYTETFTIDDARKGLVLAELPDVWSALADYPRLGEVATLRRGLQWKNDVPESVRVRSTPTPGYVRGVAPRTKFCAFETPPIRYLDARPQDQRRNAWQYNWAKPKAIVNKARKSRTHWRLAAFADRDGVACSQSLYGVWPKSPQYDPVVLAAILNGPVANAFVATREGNRDITKEVLQLIPVPVLSQRDKDKLHTLVAKYEASVAQIPFGVNDDQETLLMEIDATVLDGYRLAPRLERAVLDYFNDSDRPARHGFRNYFPPDLDIYVSLSQYLDPKFSVGTVGELLRRLDAR